MRSLSCCCRVGASGRIFAGAGYIVESNYEYGLGRPDSVVKDKKNRRALIIEMKHSKNEEKLEADSHEALTQIADQRYAEQFLRGYRKILCYGIACCGKECLAAIYQLTTLSTIARCSVLVFLR